MENCSLDYVGKLVAANFGWSLFVEHVLADCTYVLAELMAWFIVAKALGRRGKLFSTYN